MRHPAVPGIRGFTLIELLIVVAIIAILAAIAVPNFLEAQTRAKVSRAEADMRTIATAIESYAIDCNRYPPNPNLGDGLYVTPWRLTTPVAYLASRPVDPFKDKQNAYPGIAPALHGERWLYDYFSIISSAECLRLEKQKIRTFYVAVDASGLYASVANRRAFLKYGLWMQWSAGPDGVFWIVGDDFQYPANASPLKAPSHRPWGYSFDVPYDASNGTRSFGNLFRTQKLTRGAATDPEA